MIASSMPRFEWEGRESLKLALQMPIERITLFLYSSRPNILNLHRRDGSVLQIFPKIYDVSDRIEVGYLSFSLSSNGEKLMGLNEVPIPKEGFSFSRMSKLMIVESGIEVESGFVVWLENGKSVKIAAGAFPYTLAIYGIGTVPHGNEPEYDWDDYEIIPWQ